MIDTDLVKADIKEIEKERSSSTTPCSIFGKISLKRKKLNAQVEYLGRLLQEPTDKKRDDLADEVSDKIDDAETEKERSIWESVLKLLDSYDIDFGD